MPRYNATVVFTDGRGALVNGLQAKNKILAYKEILINNKSEADKILSITVIEKDYKQQ